MRIHALEIADFRNVAAATLRPSPRATVLYGQNGQGKTNLLEATYFLSALRPIRQGRLAELIRFGQPLATVRASVEAPGGPREVSVVVEPGGRTLSVDGKAVPGGQGLESYLEGLTAVCFAPDDLLLVKGGPELRRRFLDRAAFNRWPAVLRDAREYVRALRARNAALRTGDDAVDESFRATLARAGARLVARRLALVRELTPFVAAAFREISGPGAPPLDLTYRAAGGLPASLDEVALGAALAEGLARRLARDRERAFTSLGPHMDELTIGLSGHGARAFASQGQQRALVLALKIGEIEALRAALGRPPLLLLDDVSSELDPAKNAYLLEYLASLPGQLFLTTTDRRLVGRAAGPDARFYEVIAGGVREDIS